MIRLRWAPALLIASCAAIAGCAGHPVAQAPASPPQVSASAASTSSAAATAASATTAASPSATARRTASTPPRPAVSSSAAGRVAPVSAKARAAGLLDIRTVVADAVIDLRYTTSDNFVGVPLYPADARCLVHESMAAGLAVAADRLRRQGYLLVFWDCYRPHPVQVRMFEIVPNPNWVARPGPTASSHEAARSVDVSLAHASTGLQCPAAQRVQRHCLLDLGTGFDDFTPRAYAYATDGISQQARTNRALLRSAMNAGGIVVYSGEWWHFDGPGAKVRRPHLDVPLD